MVQNTNHKFPAAQFNSEHPNTTISHNWVDSLGNHFFSETLCKQPILLMINFGP